MLVWHRIMFFFSSHCRCMCCCHQCSLHHLCANWVNNDNIHQSSKIISSVKDIHSLLGVAREKVGDLHLTCASFSKTIVTIIFQSVSWATVCSFSQGHRSKWVPKLLMVWSHQHCERWATVRCGKPRWVRNVVRKWADDKGNVGVVGQANNQAPTLEPAHEQRRIHMISKGMFIRSEANSCSCKQSTKETCNWG